MATLNKKFAVLIDECAKENKLIKTKPKLNPVYDGLLGDEKDWKKQETRIMWVLKNPYDDFTKKCGKPRSTGDGWSLKDIIDESYNDPDEKKSPFHGESSRTWRPILYISYAIIDNVKLPFDEFELSEYKTKDLDYLRKLAVINVGKMPGNKQTAPSELYDNYSIWKNVLLSQIEKCNPNIIIFGGTFELFKRDKCFSQKFIIESEPDYRTQLANFRADFYKDKNKNVIIIDTYHPSVLFKDRINDILYGLKELKK